MWIRIFTIYFLQWKIHAENVMFDPKKISSEYETHSHFYGGLLKDLHFFLGPCNGGV